MLRAQRAGVDAGATQFRLLTDSDPGNVLTLPNYLWPDPDPDLLKAPARPEDAIHLHVIESPCDVPAEFAFGEFAVAHGKPLDPEVSKLRSPQIRAGLVATLAAHAARFRLADPMANPVYHLAVGIPMLDYTTRTESRAFLREEFLLQFRGTYRVRFDRNSNPKWGALGDITFYVQGLLPVPEGLPALDVVPDLDESARWQAVADIGGSTLDIPVFERVVEDGAVIWDLRNDYCGTATTGLNDAMDDLTRHLNRQNPGWRFKRTEYEHYLAECDGELPNGGNILTTANQYLRPVVARVAEAIADVCSRRPEVRTVILIGGGAILLHVHLRLALRQMGVSAELQVPANPRLLNVKGFLLHAQGAFGNG